MAYAREGSRLYDGHQPGHELTTLKRMTIRGVESFSMICSEKELGISDEHEGVMILDDNAPEGMPLVDYMGDAVFSIAIMPNMIHCSSVIGIAREVAGVDPATLTPAGLRPAGERQVDKGQGCDRDTRPGAQPALRARDGRGAKRSRAHIGCSTGCGWRACARSTRRWTRPTT